MALLMAITLQAQKRVNNRLYNPDPAPVVSGDRLYVFTGHDLDTATYFRMPDWQVFSTTDMEHWTDHGIVLTTAHFKWAKQGDNAWASQAIERNGKWYWYVAAEDTTKHIHGIGVAIADRPEGPWKDPIGKPLIPGNWGFIDPTVFIDDDGQAYMFVGQNTCCCIKLNDDMISYDGEVHIIEGLEEFFEASWVHKYNGKYYLSYSNSPFTGHQPEIVYAMADNPLGPYEYKGRILGPVSSGTNHHSIVQFGDDWFLFYHTGDLGNYNWPGRGMGGSHRSVCVDYLYYNEDGTIREVQPTVSQEKLEKNTAFKGDY